MCATDPQIVQASASSSPSEVVEADMDAPATADFSLSLAGPERGIEFRIRQRDLVAASTDICDPIGPATLDIQLEIDLIRRESKAAGETSGTH
jgi:hypothetical protein